MNTYSPLVSIIVPVYKVEKYLHTCINSVLSQTYKNWELILVDDGSPDKCGVICDEYAQKDQRISVIHKENGGQAQARNWAIDICRGRYVTFLDSDDYFHPEGIKYMIDLAEKHQVDMVQCGYVRGIDTEFPQINQRLIEEIFDNHSVFLSGMANVIVWGKLYRREIILANRIHEGKYYEDDFTTWKWYYNSKKIIVSNKILYYYTNNPASTMAQHAKKPSLDFFEAYDERISFFQTTGEHDLEHCSRLQLCKSLVLTYSNRQLTENERILIKNNFENNWKILKSSPYIKRSFKGLFFLFHFLPYMVSQLSTKLR